MFGSRTRKIFREISGRKGRTALASIAIFVGVLGVVILFSVYDLVTTQMEEDLKEDELAMLDVFVALPGPAEIDNAAYIEMLEALPGVENVEGRANNPLSWKLPDDERFETGYILAAWEPFEEMAIQPMRVVDGEFPEAGKNEVAIEKRMANAHGLGLGDQLVVRVLSGGVPVEETWTIVGVVFQPYGLVGPPGLDPNEVSVFATFEDARHIVGYSSLTNLYTRFIDFDTAQRQADRFAATILEETPYVVTSTFLDDPAENQALTSAREVTSQLSSLGILAMIVSGFLVTNIINTIVTEQRQQIGVMKSLGATRLDNLLMYIGIALSYGVIGVVPGVLFGVFLGSGVAAQMASFVGTYLEGFNVSAAGVLTGIVMGLLVPLVAALIPVFLGTRVTILQAMTDLGISVDYGRGLLSRLIAALPLPINVRQALSNVTRKKGRLVLTMVTLTLAVGFFMGIYGLFYSLNDVIGTIFDTFNSEILVIPYESQDFEEMRTLITDNVDGIKGVFPAVSLEFQVEGYVSTETGQSAVAAMGFDTQSDSIHLELEAGDAWREDPDREGVVFSSSLANQMEKDVGDRFVFSAGGSTYEREIIGITSLQFDMVFLNWRELAEIGGFAREGPSPNAWFIQTTAADASADEVDGLIEQITEALLAEGVNTGSYNYVRFSESIASAIQNFMFIFLMAVFVMAAVGAIGLLATLSMAVFERQKEIGVMRSIGAGSATIAGQYLVEGNLMGILAWIVGLPIAFGVSQMLLGGIPFEIEPLPPASLVIGLVGMIVIATISSLWPSISAARKTVSEIIRYQ